MNTGERAVSPASVCEGLKRSIGTALITENSVMALYFPITVLD